MRILRVTVAVIALLAFGAAVAAGCVVAASQWPLIAALEAPPPRSAFSASAISKGARLAAVGNCHVCHTVSDDADYAGNRPIPTPFGTVYSTNITPAPGSGIGRWSLAAFRRAMRDGIARNGAHLYPAFPYDHYALLTDGDIDALYAFLMTRHPVETYQTANRLPFPLGQRWLIAFWNLLFFHPVPFRPDPEHDAQWNRGKYLVEGLGHCGDCHTPRNLLGAEENGHALAGGEAEGWTAPALTIAPPAPAPWDAAHLFNYLRQGWDGEHGAAAGPMQPVADELAQADEADVRAIALYVAAQQDEASSSERRRAVTEAMARAGRDELPKPAPGEELGAAIFGGACARCHVGGPPMVPPHGIDLALSTAINEADPDDAIRIVLDGVRPPDERVGPFMPPLAGSFSDGQVAALLAYVRAHYGGGSGRAAWPDLAAKVHDIAHRGGQ